MDLATQGREQNASSRLDLPEAGLRVRFYFLPADAPRECRRDRTTGRRPVSALAYRPNPSDNLTHTVNAATAKILPPGAARGLAAAVMLCLWLALGLASSSPQIHHRLHADSHQTSHECVVTLLSKGLFAGPESASVNLVAPLSSEWMPAALSLVHVPSSDVRLAPGRAPPAGFALSSSTC